MLAFADAAAWRAWLAVQPADARGCWMRIAKKGAPEPTVSKSDAVDGALAHGWIDGQLRGWDAGYALTRFTPRRRKAIWSQVNRERVERLLAAGRMTPAGLAEVERAKADGRWGAAYPPASRAEPPPELLAALAARPDAQALWEELDAANRYAVLHRVHQARPAARAAKAAALADQLARGETIHPRKARRS